jgi:hypothetical protein
MCKYGHILFRKRDRSHHFITYCLVFGSSKPIHVFMMCKHLSKFATMNHHVVIN